jgi:hypothetical protein
VTRYEKVWVDIQASFMPDYTGDNSSVILNKIEIVDLVVLTLLVFTSVSLITGTIAIVIAASVGILIYSVYYVVRQGKLPKIRSLLMFDDTTPTSPKRRLSLIVC